MSYQLKVGNGVHFLSNGHIDCPGEVIALTHHSVAGDYALIQYHSWVDGRLTAQASIPTQELLTSGDWAIYETVESRDAWAKAERLPVFPRKPAKKSSCVSDDEIAELMGLT
jgi:hypothetical protein